MGIVYRNGLAVARRFAQADVARNNRVEHLAAEVFLHFLRHLDGQIRPAVVHRHEQSQELQAGIQIVPHHVHGLHELGQPFQRVKLALHGNEDEISRRQGVERQQPQRRRAVDDDVVVGLLHLPQVGLQGLLQNILAVFHRDQLHRRAGDVHRGRYEG